MEEFTEEQKLRTKSIGDLVAAINALSSKFAQFEEKLEKLKEVIVSVDTKPVQDILKKAIVDIKLTVAARPKNTVREFNFHLFPKLNIMEYYRTYSRLLLFLSLFLVVAGLVSIGMKWIKAYNQRQQQLPQILLKNTLKPYPGTKIKKISHDHLPVLTVLLVKNSQKT